MRRINDLTAVLKVAADDYKKRYDAILANRKTKEQELSKNYIPGSDLYKSEKQNISDDFAKKVEELQEEIDSCVRESFEELRAFESMKVKSVDAVALGKMNALYDIPLTTSELSALNQQFGKNKDYWCEKILAQMCEKNGVKPSVLGLESDYETKMNIIAELEKRMKDLFDMYEGEFTVTTEMLLHESVLGRYELKYAGSYENLCLTSADVANSAFNAIVSKNSISEKGIALHNVMRNADELTQAELMSTVLENDYKSKQWVTREMREKIEKFEKNGLSQYKKAKQIIEEAKKAENSQKASEIVTDAGENKYLSMMVDDERKVNPNFAVVKED